MTPLDELKAALQPLVDASLQYPTLKRFLPRVGAALSAVEAAWPAPVEEPRKLKNRSGTASNSEATEAALKAVAGGEPVARAARTYGIDPSTLFRALKRARESTS